MNRSPSTYNAYIDLKKHRLQKKRKLYKLALGVSFDLTITFYLGAFLLFGLFISYETIQQYHEQFSQIERIASNFYVDILVICIIRAMVISFTKPGILFSSAELQLSLLPYSRKKLWIYCILDKALKFFALLLLLVIIIGMITPFSFIFLLKVAGIVSSVHVLMIIPQWRLYQLGIWYKILIMFLMSVVGGITRIGLGLVMPVPLLLTMLFLLLVLVNLVLSKNSLRHVNWMKVVQTNDLIIWNMWFINKMSKMEIKPQKRQGLLQNLFRSKRSRRPFSYQNSTAVYRRLWKIYFFDQKQNVMQTIGSIVTIFIILSFKGGWILGLGFALSIFLFAQMAAGFFTGGFGERIIFNLPWDLYAWKKAFLSWAYQVGILIVIVAGITLFFYNENQVWIPLQLIFYISVAVYVTNILINERIIILSKMANLIPVPTTIFIVVLFILVIYSISYPALSAAVLLIIIKSRMDSKRKSI